MQPPDKTKFAMQAINLAELFTMMLGQERLAPASYRLELSAPEGPSTGGGKQAVQHIKLIPERGGQTIVAGSVNQVDKSAELRSWNKLAEIHAQRFKGAALPLDRTQYGAAQARMKQLLEQQGLGVLVLDAPPPETGGGSGGILLGIILLLAVGGAAAYFLTR